MVKEAQTYPEPGSAEASPPAPEGAARRKGLLVPLLTGGTVLGLVLAVTFAVLWLTSADTSPDEVSAFLAREEAQVAEVTREVVTLLINYDSTNLEQRSEEILPLATGSFREQYEDLIGEGLGEALSQARASSRGEILSGPDVTFAGPSEAISILRTTQTTQSRDNPTGRTFVYVMKLTLVDTASEGWKADRVEILSQQES